MLVISATIIERIEDMQKSGLASLAIYYYDFKGKGKRDLRGVDYVRAVHMLCT